MPKYRVTIEFETDSNLNPDVLEEKAIDMSVQTESLPDGKYEEEYGVKCNYKHLTMKAREV